MRVTEDAPTFCNNNISQHTSHIKKDESKDNLAHTKAGQDKLSEKRSSVKCELRLYISFVAASDYNTFSIWTERS